MKLIFSLILLTSLSAMADEIQDVRVTVPEGWSAKLVLHYTATANLTSGTCTNKVWDGEEFKFRKVPKIKKTTAKTEMLGSEESPQYKFYGTNLRLSRRYEKCHFQISHVYLSIYIEGMKDPGGLDVESYVSLYHNDEYEGDEQMVGCKLVNALYCSIDRYYISSDGAALIKVNNRLR